LLAGFGYLVKVLAVKHVQHQKANVDSTQGRDRVGRGASQALHSRRKEKNQTGQCKIWFNFFSLRFKVITDQHTFELLHGTIAPSIFPELVFMVGLLPKDYSL